ncbi:MAG: hypothetical protein H0X36_08015 [Sphingomonadaceae bacterium]|nr:hypothetical protein [Sphingomonadaceae bacterium]
MKALIILGALALGTAATPALAQMNAQRTTTTTTTSSGPMHEDRTVVRRTSTVRHGWHNGWRRHRVCTMQWRNHHRVRRCWWR